MSFANLTSRSFDESYYTQHLAEGLDYLHYADWQFRYARWLADVFSVAGKHTLDLGCACGNLVQGFHDQGCDAVGIDACEYMIRRGRERFPSIRLEIGDVSNLHLFADGQFDFLHSMQSAEHWSPHLVPVILRECWRVAKRDALFWCVLDTEELGQRQGRDLRSEDPTHVCIKPFFWWRDQLAAAGWEVVSEDYRMALLEHGWSYLHEGGCGNAHDWDWFVARRTDYQSPDPLIKQDGWWIRANQCFADHSIIQEVYHQDCYDYQHTPSHPEEVVVDVGACIGAFSRLALKKNPRARVLCVEANSRNVPCLRLNVPQATVIDAAMTYVENPALLNGVFEGSLNTGCSQVYSRDVVEGFSGDGLSKDLSPLKSITLEQIFEQHNLSKIDVLKLDCEGSEFDILKNCSVLDRVAVIMGEYHVSRQQFESLVKERLPSWFLQIKGEESLGLFWLVRR